MFLIMILSFQFIFFTKLCFICPPNPRILPKKDETQAEALGSPWSDEDFPQYMMCQTINPSFQTSDGIGYSAGVFEPSRKCLHTPERVLPWKHVIYHVTTCHDSFQENG